MSFLCNQNLSINTDLHAANGKRVKALDIFAYALAFFKEQALKVTHVEYFLICLISYVSVAYPSQSHLIWYSKRCHLTPRNMCMSCVTLCLNVRPPGAE